MARDVDERVPRGGATLITIFGLPGAVVGLLLWGIVDAAAIPDTREWLKIALAFGLVIGAGTYVLTVLKGQVLRAGLTGGVSGLIVTGLISLAQLGQAPAISEDMLPVLACLVIATVALPFLRAGSKGNKLFDYRPLYADAWTIPAIVGVAQIFVVVGWILAGLIAALFNFIGLSFLLDALDEAWFILPYFGLLEAVGVGVVRQRESEVLAARSIGMALIRAAAPVFAACATIFVGAVMIRGFGSLIEGLSPVGTLTAAAAVAIIMINAIVADEGRPQTSLFGATSRLLGVLLLFLMALAIYGLYMRIDAEGWTPNRIAATVAVTVFALYAPIYAAAALFERWEILRRGNIAMSFALVAIAVFIQTPLFRPLDWSVNSQIAILEEEGGEASFGDLAYIRDRLGEPGRDAYDALLQDEGVLAERARELGDRPAYALYGDKFDGEDTIVVATGRLPIPDAMRKLAIGKAPISSEVILIRNDEDHVVTVTRAPSYLTANWYVRDGEDWRLEGGENLYLDEAATAALLKAARAGEFTFEERTYRLPAIGGRVLPSAAERLEDYRVEPGLGAGAEEAN